MFPFRLSRLSRLSRFSRFLRSYSAFSQLTAGFHGANIPFSFGAQAQMWIAQTPSASRWA